MPPSPAVITQHTPGLQSRDCVLDARATSAVGSPGTIADDTVVAKHRRDQLGNTAVATIGENARMVAAPHLDAGCAVVDRIIAVAGTAAVDRDDAQVHAAGEDRKVARPAVVLGFGGTRVV